MARGKDPAGQVTILTDTRPGDGGIGEVLLIVIGDDGNGIDPSRIRTKLATIDPNGAWRFEDDNRSFEGFFPGSNDQRYTDDNFRPGRRYGSG